jgi:integral membrane protein
MVMYFKMIGWLEGTSLLTLLFIAMPLKYIGHDPMPVRIVGSIHGGLFLLYVGLACFLFDRDNWSRKELVTAWILSVVPFGTFIFERKYLRAYDGAKETA